VTASARGDHDANAATVTGWLSRVFQVDPTGVSWQRGAVLLDITLVPLVVFWAIGHEEYLLSAVFGALFVALADPGGPIGHSVSTTAVYALAGAAMTALAFGISGAASGWLALAAFAVTLVAGLAAAFGVHRFVAALLLNIWFLVALSLGVSLDEQARVTSHTWAQVLAWTGGAALWIVGASVAWLVGGRQDRDQVVAELPGDTSRRPLTRSVVLFAVIRAVVIGGLVAIVYGQDLSHGDWMPIAAIVAMKPSLGQTTLVAVQRLTGALIGAVAAALLMLVPAHEHGADLVSITHGLEVVAIVLFMHAAAIRFWSYAVYCAAVAAGALVMVDLPHPSDYSAEGYRVLWTFCGVGVAVVVMLLAERLARRAPDAGRPTPAGQGD
jgi:hypothetical protein